MAPRYLQDGPRCPQDSPTHKAKGEYAKNNRFWHIPCPVVFASAKQRKAKNVFLGSSAPPKILSQVKREVLKAVKGKPTLLKDVLASQTLNFEWCLALGAYMAGATCSQQANLAVDSLKSLIPI